MNTIILKKDTPTPPCFGTRLPLSRDSHDGRSHAYCWQCVHGDYCGTGWRGNVIGVRGILAHRNAELYEALVKVLLVENDELRGEYSGGSSPRPARRACEG